MNSLRLLIAGTVALFIANSCNTDTTRNETRSKSFEQNTNAAASESKSIPIGPKQSRSFEARTVTTSLSQTTWPSSEGNVVKIHLRDSVTARTEVIIYGEIGRIEYGLRSINGLVTNGVVREISYAGKSVEALDSDSTLPSDTCVFDFTTGLDGRIACTEVKSKTRTKSLECRPCAEIAMNLTRLKHDIEKVLADIRTGSRSTKRQ